MRKLACVLVTASAAAVGFVSAAAAADMGVPVRRLAAVPYTWTGFYVGGNLGYGVDDDPTTLTTAAGPRVFIAPAGAPIYGAAPNFNLASRGWNGGLQAGYNWQFLPNWIVGFETDFQGSSLDHRSTCILPCGTQIALVPGILGALFPVTFSDDSLEHNLRWFGTVRGRFGYAVGPAMVYITGGLAYADIERNGNVAGSTTLLGIIPINSFGGGFNTSSVKTGGTIGAGVEAKLGGGFSVKAEYLFVDFGTINDTFSTVFTTSLIPGQAGTVAATRTFSTTVRENIFRIGVNYQFGSYPAVAYK
jgi:outer membrane immunogenic protein